MVVPLPYSSLALHDVARQTSFEQIPAFPLNTCRAGYSFILRIAARPTFRRKGSPLPFPCERLTRWLMIPIRSVLHTHSRNCVTRTTWGLFPEGPENFGRISDDIILFVSSKQRRLEARNFAIIFIFIPFTTYEKTSFTE